MQDIDITSSCSEGQLISLPIKDYKRMILSAFALELWGLLRVGDVISQLADSLVRHKRWSPMPQKCRHFVSLRLESHPVSQDYGHLSAGQMCTGFFNGWIGWDFDCCNTASEDIWYQLPGSLAPGPPGRDERNITKGSPWEQRNSSRLWYILFGQCQLGDSLPKHLRDLRIKEEPLRALCAVFQRHDFSGGLLRCWWSLLVCSTEDEPDTQRSFWNSVHTIWLGLFTLQVGTAVGCAEFGCFVHLCGWQVSVPNLWALWLPWKLGVLWRAQNQGSMPQCGRCHRQDPGGLRPSTRQSHGETNGVRIAAAWILAFLVGYFLCPKVGVIKQHKHT